MLAFRNVYMRGTTRGVEPDMLKAVTVASVVVAAAGTLAARVQQPPATPPTPAGQTTAVRTTPVLSPAESMKTFKLHPGYHLEFVASEPMIEDPIVIDFDPDGRIWVIEMNGYMNTCRRQ